MQKIISHLKENWLRYGFETIVVVVGILGAYALNNWNQQRLGEQQEYKYLTLLQEDFVTNKKLAEHNKFWNEELLKMANLLLKITSSDTTVDARWIALAIHHSYYNNIVIRISDTWTDLLSTGSIDLIKNENLRKTISSYYSASEGYEVTRSEFLSHYLALRESISVILTAKERMLVFNNSTYLSESFDPENVPFRPNSEELKSKIRNVIGLHRRITDVIMSREVSIIIHDSELKNVENIIKMIDLELTRWE